MKRILVVEDDPAILRGLTEALRDQRYEVLTAADGGTGYHLGQRRDVDLIILDLILPQKKGEDVCHDLRGLGIKTPILMLTSKKTEADRVAGLDLGADDYVMKPFSLNELQARVRALLRRQDEYHHATREIAELKRDLDMARKVQENLFPKHIPSVRGWECAARCRPALAVGGDYYDAFELSADKIFFTLGDVSGKGLVAALVMTNVVSAVRNRSSLFVTEPIRFIAELNRYLLMTSSPETFVTLFLCAVDVMTGWMLYVNCGHPPPLLIRSGTETIERLADGGTILGVFQEAQRSLGEKIVGPEDVLVMFSDGVTEATNKKNEFFTEERLLQVVSRRPAGQSSQMLETIVGSVDDFTEHAPPADDISVPVLRRTDVRHDKTV